MRTEIAPDTLARLMAKALNRSDETEATNEVAALARKQISTRGFAWMSLARGAIDAAVAERLLQAISERMGRLLPQTYRHNTIAHIRDEGRDYAQPSTRGHQTNAELAFHSDRCDLNLLFYVRAPREGGALSIVEYAAAAERLKAIDPDALGVLFDGFPFDLRDERIFPSNPWCWRPVLWGGAGGVRGHYIRRFIHDSQRHEDCPRLSGAQIAALDAWDGVLAQLREAHTSSPQPGDFVVVDNFRVMHARRAFVDHADSGRLALRTWVAPFDSEPLPAFLHPMMGACAGGAFRGGVGCDPIYRARLGRIDDYFEGGGRE